MKQIELPLPGEPRPIDPPSSQREPTIWISRLLILRAPRLDADAVIRDLRLRRGLNILWAPPLSGAGENRLFDGRLTGHTAGKTTFCRLIRYLLGEERFGTGRAQDRIRERVPDGWVVGEIWVRGEPWVVGRPFALGVHPFAAPKVTIEKALTDRGSYQDFLAELERAIVAPIPVKMLPNAKKHLDWPLVLTWLTRDQEARFAHVVGWRDTSSESASPSPTMGDRYVVVRALLNLMSDEESALQQKSEALKGQKEQLDSEAPVLRARAADDRRRLSSLLGLGEPEGEAGPLFAPRLREGVAERRAALGHAEAALAAEEAAEEEARRAWADAVEERGACRARRRDAEARLEEERRALAQLEAPEPAVAAKAAPSLPLAAAPGYCNVPLSLAHAEGCPLAVGAEALRHRGLAEGEGDRRRAVIAALAQQATAAAEALGEAEAAEDSLLGAYRQKSAALQEDRGKVARERAALSEIERLLAYAAETEAAAQTNDERTTEAAREAQRLAERRTTRQREHKEALGRLSERFAFVLQALLGRQVGGSVEVRAGQVDLHAAEHGERDSAAMETIKILAFDLAALTLGLEGQGYFPGFLIHDGPREADMDQRIYERVFLYAAEKLEEAFRGVGEPAFQYIVTTTAAPPKRLSRAPWVLEPKLDASVPEGRLLGMNL